MNQPNLDRVLTHLYALEYPVLRRPSVQSGAPETAELIAWAIDVYTFILTVHVRHLLESFCLLTRSRHWPTTFLVARALLEVAGQATHVLRKLRAWIARADFSGSWALLSAASYGSSTLSERGAVTPDDTTPFPGANPHDERRARVSQIDSRADT